MKKTFILTHPKKNKDRLFEAAIHDVKKYIKREQKKALPEDFDCWDFDCRFGKTEPEAKTITRDEIVKYINDAQEENLESFYLEILAKPGIKKKRIKIDNNSTDKI